MDIDIDTIIEIWAICMISLATLSGCFAFIALGIWILI